MPTTNTGAGLLILAQGATWERRFQVSSLAASATALGEEVDVFLSFAALDAWVRGSWDRLDPEGPLMAADLQSAAFPPLSTLLDSARATGLLRLYGCSASVRLLGLDPALAQSRLDTIAGWPTIAQRLNARGRVVGF